MERDIATFATSEKYEIDLDAQEQQVMMLGGGSGSGTMLFKQQAISVTNDSMMEMIMNMGEGGDDPMSMSMTVKSHTEVYTELLD